MKLIVDTNIVFSSLLSNDNRYINLLYSSTHTFYTCNFLFVEIFKHSEKIKKSSKLGNDDLLNHLANILSKVHFINENNIPKDIFKIAYDLCKGIDEKDVPFLALAIFLDGYLLTKDTTLVKGLYSKGFKRIINFNIFDY
jgi:predicted nucleic acid-binding protein